MEKFKAPYTNHIILKIPRDIFTSPGYISNLTILVGTNGPCSKLKSDQMLKIFK